MNQPNRKVGIRIDGVSAAHFQGHGDIIGWLPPRGECPKGPPFNEANTGRSSPSLPLDVGVQVFGASPAIKKLHGENGGPTTALRTELPHPSGSIGDRPEGIIVSSNRPQQVPVRVEGISQEKLRENEHGKSAQNRPSTATQRQAANVAYEAVLGPRTLFIRALTSRLAEIKSLSASWLRTDDSSEAAYLSTLKHVRDSAHEWAAVDVVRALNGCNGTLYVQVSTAQDTACESSLCPVPVPVRGGIPAWSYPSYPRTPWARYLVPVWESLLYSVYEDYAMAGLEGVRRGLEAVEPAFTLARSCSPHDLLPLDSEERAQEQADEVEDGAMEGGKEDEERRARLNDDRTHRHAAAVSAVDTVRRTFPLLAALATAAQNPGSCARLASSRGKRLAELHHSVSHLTAAA